MTCKKLIERIQFSISLQKNRCNEILKMHNVESYIGHYNRGVRHGLVIAEEILKEYGAEGKETE